MKTLNKTVYGLLVYIFSSAGLGFFVAGCIDVVPFVGGCILCAMCMIFLGVTIYVYRKDKEGDTLKNVSMVCLMILYIGMIFLTEVDAVYAWGLVVLSLYVLFFDVKLIIITGICMLILNMISVAVRLITGKMHSGKPLDGRFIFVQCVCICAFVVIIIMVTKLSKRFNDEKIQKIEQESEKNKKLLEEVLKTANSVSNSMQEGTEYVAELDTMAENALSIFREIAAGNNTNTVSVSKQTEMSSEITKLIDGVALDTVNAVKTAQTSIQEIKKSKKSMNDFKEKSNELIDYNNDVSKLIGEFVENVHNVRKITEGITEISDQTNLLSLNATIESARAGQAGKGFAVVAEAIRNLAEETNILTQNIEKIVKSLENNAESTQRVINKVVEGIEDERNTIENMVEEFTCVENDMATLENDMNNILSRTEGVVNYNKGIMEHVAHLSASTEELSAYTEDALTMYEENKRKTHDTKLVIDKVEDEILRLVNM